MSARGNQDLEDVPLDQLFAEVERLRRYRDALLTQLSSLRATLGHARHSAVEANVLSPGASLQAVEEAGNQQEAVTVYPVWTTDLPDLTRTSSASDQSVPTPRTPVRPASPSSVETQIHHPSPVRPASPSSIETQIHHPSPVRPATLSSIETQVHEETPRPSPPERPAAPVVLPHAHPLPRTRRRPGAEEEQAAAAAGTLRSRRFQRLLARLRPHRSRNSSAEADHPPPGTPVPGTPAPTAVMIPEAREHDAAAQPQLPVGAEEHDMASRSVPERSIVPVPIASARRAPVRRARFQFTPNRGNRGTFRFLIPNPFSHGSAGSSRPAETGLQQRIRAMAHTAPVPLLRAPRSGHHHHHCQRWSHPVIWQPTLGQSYAPPTSDNAATVRRHHQTPRQLLPQVPCPWAAEPGANELVPIGLSNILPLLQLIDLAIGLRQSNATNAQQMFRLFLQS